MAKIKVAHIITDLDIGGAEKMLLKLLRNFKNARYEHIVISLMPPGRIGRMMEKEGFKVYSVQLNRYNVFAALVRLYRILKEEKVQIAHNYLFHADFLGRIAAKAAGVPVVISSFRSVDIGGRWREMLLSMTDFCVDRVTAVSRKVATVHALKNTARKEKFRIIYNGLEFGNNQIINRQFTRRNMNVTDDTFLLLSVGRLEPVKGYTFLFAAIETLIRKGRKVKLLVIGEGEGRKTLEPEIIVRRLGNDVILAGEKEEVSEFFKIADAYIMPSLWEGMPNALLEAMEAGLPVIATDVGGVSEVVTDGETGLLIEPADEQAITAAIERLMGDEGLCGRLAEKAAENVRRNFDIKNTVKDVEKLYEEVLR